VPCTIFTWCTLKRLCMYLTTNSSRNRTAGLVIMLQAGQFRVWRSAQSRFTTFFLSPKCSGCLWGPPSLLVNGFQGFFPRGDEVARVWSRPPPFSNKLGISAAIPLLLPLYLHSVGRTHLPFQFFSDKVARAWSWPSPFSTKLMNEWKCTSTTPACCNGTDRTTLHFSIFPPN